MASKSKPNISDAKAGEFHALDASKITWPDPVPGDKPKGQAHWGSVKQRQKGESGKTYTAGEVEDIVEAAVAQALKRVGITSDSKESKENELVIGGK